MHFKHPELLYALFLLVIPILVHLFQLRRFRTEAFTNIKFLKRASLVKRRSSRIKKWLVLGIRLLLLTSIIVAFAQPFVPATEESLLPRETVIYLDNSYSMQAKGPRGNLLRRSVQDLLEQLPQEESFSLFTNDEVFENIRLDSHRQELQDIEFAPSQLDWQMVGMRAQRLFSEDPRSKKNLIAVSDFQEHVPYPEFDAGGNYDWKLVQVGPENKTNAAVDTAFVVSSGADQRQLEIGLKGTGDPKRELAVSVYSGSHLLAKKSLRLGEDLRGSARFQLPKGAIEQGAVRIEPVGAAFDDQVYFSLNERAPIGVVAINGKESGFLERIFTGPEFEFRQFPEDQLDHRALSEADLVVLNELGEIRPLLASALSERVREDLHLIVVPSHAAGIGSYNSFFQQMNLPQFGERIEREVRVTEISQEHALFEGVFEERAENFDFPRVASYYRILGNAFPVLGFENQEPFLFQNGQVAVFTAALNRENSDFQQSPLVVTTFYNLGLEALAPPQLYYTAGASNQVEITADLGQDEVLKLSSGAFSFIPRQQRYGDKVELRLEEEPSAPGHYEITRDSLSLLTLSFNIDRRESELVYHELDLPEGVEGFSGIAEALESITAEKEIDSLWKWFVIFALFLLLMEMLILKFYK